MSSFLVSVMAFITCVEILTSKPVSRQIEETAYHLNAIFHADFLHMIMAYGCVILTVMANTLYAYVCMS